MKGKIEGMTVCKNFKLTKKLGTGAFGEIYLAVNKSNEEEMYAAKLEDATAKNPQLFFEAKLYKYLNTEGTQKGIPRVYAATTEGQYNIMLMDLLGKSLEDLFVEANKKFSLKTVLIVADQMLERIEFLHSKQFLHRDIKPDNFLMGREKNAATVYIIDMGLSKKYIKDGTASIDSGKHIPYKDGKELTGTARYASINTHIGIEQSRRDDIESIGYVLMYFLRGILPWQNMKAKDTKQKYNMIMEKKMSTPVDVLCKGFPTEFVTYLNYAKNLKFEDKPDYLYLRKLFEDLRKKSGVEMDGIYDWTKVDTKPVQQQKGFSVDKKAPEQASKPPQQPTTVYSSGNVADGGKTLQSKTTMNQMIGKAQAIASQKVPAPRISTIKP